MDSPEGRLPSWKTNMSLAHFNLEGQVHHTVTLSEWQQDNKWRIRYMKCDWGVKSSCTISTHVPPTGMNWPFLTKCWIWEKSPGYQLFTHWNCWAWTKKRGLLRLVKPSQLAHFFLNQQITWEQAKTKSGFFSIKRTTVTQLRPHLRMVSSYGHSQAADTKFQSKIYHLNVIIKYSFMLLLVKCFMITRMKATNGKEIV